MRLDKTTSARPFRYPSAEPEIINGPGRVTGPSFPPFNIERLGADSYRITLALAGFRPTDVEVVKQGNLLTVRGSSDADGKDREGFLHRGIITPPFVRQFELADFMEVLSADMRDGLLVIELKREIPDALRPRRIEVRSEPATGAGGQGHSPS